jgi:hypothetical protein
MPKALCITGMVIAILVFVLFTADLIFGLMGMEWLAPFQSASPMMDILFAVCAAILAWLSWSTLREQD